MRRNTAALLAIPLFSRTVLHSPATFYTSAQSLKLTNFLTLKNSWLIFFVGFVSKALCSLNKKPQILHMHRILKTVNHTTGNFNSCNVLRAESKTLHTRTKIGPGPDVEISFTYQTQLSTLTLIFNLRPGTEPVPERYYLFSRTGRRTISINRAIPNPILFLGNSA